MKQHAPSSIAGFTLIELLLYIAIVGGVLLGISSFFLFSLEVRTKTQAITSVDQQGAFVMDYLTGTIRNATAITSPAPAASSSSLTLTVPTGSLSPTVFNLSGTTLQVKEGTGTSVPLTNPNVQVTSLTFVNLTRSGTGGIIQASFTLNYTNTLGRSATSYTKTFVSSAEVQE